MVFAHSIAWNLNNYQTVLSLTPTKSLSNITGGILWQLIYSFHMPLFFFISGYLTSSPAAKQYLNKTIKRSKQLLIPWITTGFIILAVKGYFGYWFLLSLWQLSLTGYLFHYISSKVNKKQIILSDLILAFIFFIILKLVFQEHFKFNFADLGKFQIFFLPFIFGILIRKHSRLANISLNTKYLSFYYITFILLFCSRYLEFISNENLYFILIRKIAQYCLPIIGSLAVIVFFKSQPNTTGFLNKIGTKSLSIYVFHILFVIQIPFIGEWIIAQSPVTCITLQLIYHSLLSFIAIYLSLGIETIISHATFIKVTLLGSK